MAKYNGHKNWAHWNIYLWINNDEGLYRLARQCVRTQSNRQNAARVMLAALSESGITETPDGARYSVSAIVGALRGM